jgi:hypothetical protein
MKKIALLMAVLIGSLAAGVCFAAPQQGSTTPSLGDLARQLKAQREKESSKPAKVFTNDNIPKSTSLTMSGSTEESAEGGSAEAGEGSATAAGGTSGEGKEKAGAHDEKYYREKMQELQSQKEMHQRELDVLEKKLSQGQMQYYSDPTKQLMQESNPGTYRSDINKKQDEIDKKKKQIAADDKAIADLEQQCQREGCPPGWLR